jgi:hypothetical protein
MNADGMTVTVHVDTTALDEALRKTQALLEQQERVQENFRAIAAAAALGTAVVASPRRVSRRWLLGLGWRNSS